MTISIALWLQIPSAIASASPASGLAALHHHPVSTRNVEAQQNFDRGLTLVYVVRDYKWSPDNSTEIEKGWIVKADTLSELSKLLSLDETTLAFTIGKYNNFCRNGVDSDFGRTGETLKVIEPPYYAMQLMPLLYNTQGGARRDKEARVLDPDGKPIPRLYAAGEFGSIWGFRYQTSTNYSECLIFGRIAGRNAALSSPLE